MAAINDGTSRLLSIVQEQATEMRPVRELTAQERVSCLFAQHVFNEDVAKTEGILASPDAALLTSDDYGEALKSATKASHLALLILLLESDRTKCAPPLLAQCAIDLVQSPGALIAVQKITTFRRFNEVPSPKREQILLKALDADRFEIVDYLVHCKSFMEEIKDKQIILDKMAEKKNPAYITEFLNLFEFEADSLIRAAKSAVQAICLPSYLAIIDSPQFKQKVYADSLVALPNFFNIKISLLLEEIKANPLKGRISNEALGVLFTACAGAGTLILLPADLELIRPDLFRALRVAIREKQAKTASELIFFLETAKIPIEIEVVTEIIREICAKMSECPSLVMALCTLLTKERLPDLSTGLLELLLSTICTCWHLGSSEDDTIELLPLFLAAFSKVVKTKQFEQIPPEVIQHSFATAARYGHKHKEAVIPQAFVTSGRFQEINPDTLFSHLKLKDSFEQIRLLDVRDIRDKPLSSLEDVLSVLCSFGNISEIDLIDDAYNHAYERASQQRLLLNDIQYILKEFYPLFWQVNCLVSFFDFRQFLIKNPVDRYNDRLGRVLVAAAHLSLQNLAHHILCRLDEISPISFERAAIASVTGSRITKLRKRGFYSWDRTAFTTKDIPLVEVDKKNAIVQEIISLPRFAEISQESLGDMMYVSVCKGDLPLVNSLLESSRFKNLPQDQKPKVLEESREIASRYTDEKHSEIAKVLASMQGGGCILS